ncbi:DUF1801 domain-containing protein [Pelagicoccus sp. SDUM812005]|uniref:DUF1801 domain-containing protein n=1 Tax=Pelagicoccus sp. SDUM812005 TaxID=3041257 RepID=UPI00280FC897|nr:DUF1801 domain-containing protein [Pelagicoccus sp. SDUM812005]MDQ8181188.1 DUF1801 domain-containing protein [Pelagicoccus sp. SDUM812005]
MTSRHIDNPEVAAVFDSYPPEPRQRLLELRSLILAVGKRIDGIVAVEESLKWGQPSYSCLSGSSIRLGWDRKSPETISLYFHCQTKLVRTFRALYPKSFTFVGNREIRFHKNDPIPAKELEHCLELAHSYHRIKNLPLLGAAKNR